MHLAENGDLALLVSDEYKRMIITLSAGEHLQTHKGIIEHDVMIGRPWGTEVYTHLGNRFLFLQPTLRDLLLEIPRKSQIMYPKDIGYILLRLSIGPGSKIVEAGTGSGALTMAFAWMVGPQGSVISYDRRADMQAVARGNLARVGLLERVDFRLRDIEEGFEERGMSAIFLDLPNPEAYLRQVRQALQNGGVLSSILPTANQVSTLIAALRDEGFDNIDVCEILLRFYKPLAERLRPTDRMVAHTGYLVFARSFVRRA